MAKNIKRRTFIKSGMTLAAVTGSAGLGTACLDDTRLFELFDQKKAVVIGSGFGGSVAALRLGLAGIDTVLLERGRQWSAGSKGKGFPATLNLATGDGRTSWLSQRETLSGLGLPVFRYAGLIERVEGDDIDAVCGAGLGGGSLVYAGVLMQPQRALFEAALPFIDYDAMATLYYPEVLSRVSGGSIPDDLYAIDNYDAIRRFVHSAEAGGLELSRTPVGFDWNVIRQEVNGTARAAAINGDFIFGCNSGAKNTLDKNYIAQARATGFVEVREKHNVIRIAEKTGGGYQVGCEVIDEFGKLQGHYTVDADYVFLAAGSLNTCKLLLREQYRNNLTGLNSEVGKHWGTNGDEVAIRITDNTQDIKQGGPAFITGFDPHNTIKPVGLVHAPVSMFEGINTQVILGMNEDEQPGEIVYQPESDSIRIHWSAAANQSGSEARDQTLRRIGAEKNSSTATLLNTLPPGTWHPLGGMVMGKACDEYGQVYGQDRLFVVDGSLLPGHCACAAPSLTIAANAERIMHYLIGNAIITA